MAKGRKEGPGTGFCTATELQHFQHGHWDYLGLTTDTWN